MDGNQRRACALVRVSSEEQAKGGYGLEFQEQDIRTFCDRNNVRLLKVFRDEGYSGSTANRPGFQAMMEWAKEKRFEVLVVWKLDRLFRDTKLTLQTVDELAALGIEFRSVQEAFTHDSNGRFLLTIFAAGAEKERKDIAMRMHAGRMIAARNGILINGGSIPAYGYRFNPATKNLEVDAEEAAVVQNIFHWLVDEKLSLYKIQARLNELRVPTKYDRLGRKKPTGTTGWWNKRTIGRILANEAYTGKYNFRKHRAPSGVQDVANLRFPEDWIVVPIPQIIQTPLFEDAQEQLRKNSEGSPRRTKKTYLLRRLLVCGYDGRKMQAASRPRNSATHECKYYFCSGVRKSHAALRCLSRSISESRIAPPIWEALKELLIHPSSVLGELSKFQRQESKVAEASQRKQELEQKEKGAEARLQRLAELYIGGAINKPFYEKEHQRLRERSGELRRELRKVDSIVVSAERMLASEGEIHMLYERYKDRLDAASETTRQEIFHTFIREVVVRGDQLEVEVNLPAPSSLMFAGQDPPPLSRKDSPSIFLQTRLLPVSKVFIRLGMQRNLGQYAARKRAV